MNSRAQTDLALLGAGDHPLLSQKGRFVPLLGRMSSS